MHKTIILYSRLKVALIALSALLLVVPWHFGKDVLDIGPCANRHQHFKIENGFWKAAEFVRSHTKLGEILLDSREDRFLNVITGISECRPFLSEPYHRFVSKHDSGFSSIEYRQQCHEELRKCDSAECINRIAKANKIRWYLTHPSDSLTWESNPNMKQVFEAEGYRVFDLDKAQSVHGND